MLQGLKRLYFLLIFVCFCLLAKSAKLIELNQPLKQQFTDETQIIRLAQNEKFSLPLNTRTISYSIETQPANSKQCGFSSSSLFYKSIEDTNLLIGEEQNIVDILPLHKKQKVFIIDASQNIIAHSLDKHFLLNKISPKTKLDITANKQTTISLVSTEDEQFIYFLTPERYLGFQTESLGSEIAINEQLPGNLVDIQKTIIYKGYLFVLSRQSGLVIYKIDKKTHLLTLTQTISEKNHLYADIEIERESQLVYLLELYEPVIKIYKFDPTEFPDANKQFTIVTQYDSLSLEKITNNHHQLKSERNININIQISRGRQEQTIMVLFLHNRHNVIAQLNYRSIDQKFQFIRYFKFSMIVNQIHIVKDIMLVISLEAIGMFPYGIHPRLIEEEFNGFMSLSSIYRIKAVTDMEFIGVTRTTLEYGGVIYQKKAEFSCKTNQNSTLRNIYFKVNLTACTSQDKILYESYCSYKKTFMIERMDLAISAPMADSLWFAMLVFLTLIVLGICMLFAMQKRKERQIRRLQLYFQQKRRSDPPPSSDRRAIRLD